LHNGPAEYLQVRQTPGATVVIGIEIISYWEIALLSQEGSGIAKRIPRGVVPYPPTFKVAALEPPRRFAPPHWGCGVQIGKSIRANPSPNGRGWPAPAGRV